MKDAIQCMSIAMLNAVPIVEASGEGEDHKQLVDVGVFTYTCIYQYLLRSNVD